MVDEILRKASSFFKSFAISSGLDGRLERIRLSGLGDAVTVDIGSIPYKVCKAGQKSASSLPAGQHFLFAPLDADHPLPFVRKPQKPEVHLTTSFPLLVLLALKSYILIIFLFEILSRIRYIKST
ncbi:hypothetical protein KKE45_02235 [Patescibacteria group bacterium]|nr:hypothetical protein [Patescibacteria group bacterium]